MCEPQNLLVECVLEVQWIVQKDSVEVVPVDSNIPFTLYLSFFANIFSRVLCFASVFVGVSLSQPKIESSPRPICHSRQIRRRYFVRSPTPRDIEVQEHELLSTMDQLIRKKRRIAFATHSRHRSGKTRQSSGWGSGLMSIFGSGGGGGGGGGGSGGGSGSGMLEGEVAALENLKDQLFLELHDLRTEYQRGQRLKTLWGKLLHIAGHFLSVYCVYKIFMSAVNILLHRVGRKDPITRG
jgi:hypothetical protein